MERGKSGHLTTYSSSTEIWGFSLGARKKYLPAVTFLKPPASKLLTDSFKCFCPAQSFFPLQAVKQNSFILPSVAALSQQSQSKVAVEWLIIKVNHHKR